MTHHISHSEVDILNWVGGARAQTSVPQHERMTEESTPPMAVTAFPWIFQTIYIFSFQQRNSFIYLLLSYSLLAHPGVESALVSGWQEFFAFLIFLRC